MASALTTPKINDNSMDLTQYKGPVVACPFCPPIVDQMTSRMACTKCMGQHFISLCKNCEATGQFKGRTVWDGGRSEHTSTCNPCGGSGFFPSRGPATARMNKSSKPGEVPTVTMLSDEPVTAATADPSTAVTSANTSIPVPIPVPIPAPGTAEMPKDAPDGAHVVETSTDNVT